MMSLSVGGLVGCQTNTSFNSVEVIGDVGDQIKEARVKSGISKQELATDLGLSLANIEIIESGKAVPTRDVIFKIQDRLHCEIILD